MGKILWLLLLLAAVHIFRTNGSLLNGFHPKLNYFNQSPLLRTDYIRNSANRLIENYKFQYLDNFNPRINDTFQQRYYIISDYYKPGGPIFLLLGNNGPAIGDILSNLLIDDIAKELNGLLIYLEHRFYGVSIGVDNFSIENLQYLTPYQALEDTAHFITFIKEQYVPVNVKKSDVYLIGIGYSGGLAIWFRQKYPHLAAGVWASSAGVVARMNNYLYNEIVGDAYRSIGGSECYHLIENGFEQMDNMIKNRQSAELSKIFHLCNDIGLDTRDIGIFFSYLSQLFAVMLYTNNINSSVNYTCAFLKNATINSSEIQALADFHDSLVSLNYTCYNISFDEVIRVYQQENFDDWDYMTLGIRPFVYQECSLLGWFPSSESKYQPFGVNFPTYTLYDICHSLFGEKFNKDYMNENANLFNTINGGLHPNVKKVIFTHGELDPFRSLGIQQELNEETPIFIIPGSTIGADLFKISDADSLQLKMIKNNITNILTKWVTE